MKRASSLSARGRWHTRDYLAALVVGATIAPGGAQAHSLTTGVLVTSTPVTRLVSEQPGSSFGGKVAVAGDVNADGFDDVLVAADNFGDMDGGAVFVYHGGPEGIGTTPASRIETTEASADFGDSIAGAGDVNGDGFDDVIVGAPRFEDHDSDSGAAFVYYGSDSGLSTEPDVRLTINRARARFGDSVAGAGDLNGDGFDDVVVGAPDYEDPEGESGTGTKAVASRGSGGSGGSPAPVIKDGAAFVYYGGDSGLDAMAPTRLTIEQKEASLGVHVDGTGDLDGDGFDDLLVGALTLDSGATDEGGAFIFRGSESGVVGEPAKQLEANQADAAFGFFSSAGDLNGDGLNELLVSAPRFDTEASDSSKEGLVLVYNGRPNGPRGIADAVLESDRGPGQVFGVGVAANGDLNGDGFNDVVVAAVGIKPGLGALIFPGGPNGVGTESAQALQLEAPDAFLNGFSVATGDVNGDGLDDVVVGDVFGVTDDERRGDAFVFHGVEGAAPPRAAGALSGAWFEPQRSGEGYLLDINRATVFLTWFTYVNGKQMWLTAHTALPEDGVRFGQPITMDTVRPVGAAFGPNFDPDDVMRLDWGTITVTFESCTKGTLEYSWTTGFGNGEHRMRRAVEGGLAGVDCR